MCTNRINSKNFSIIIFINSNLSIPCGIIALILGIIGLKSSKRGMSIAGIITGVIGMILSIVLVIAIVMLSVSIFNSAKDAIEDSDYPSSYYYYND